MKVHELIELLKTMPSDSKVEIESFDNEGSDCAFIVNGAVYRNIDDDHALPLATILLYKYHDLNEHGR